MEREQILIRVEPKTKTAWKQAAKSENRSLNNWIETKLNEAFNKQQNSKRL